jgi:hypothetical protein
MRTNPGRAEKNLHLKQDPWAGVQLSVRACARLWIQSPTTQTKQNKQKADAGFLTDCMT